MGRSFVVGLVSAGTLAFEILLVRVFAIEYFHHFATMAIGIAMLGFGAAGVLAASRGRRRVDQPAATPPVAVVRGIEAGFTRTTIAAAATLIAAPLVTHQIPLDMGQLVWDVSEWPKLAAVYALLATPFLTGGLVVLGALERERERPGGIYGASFIGSGVGAAFALAALAWLPPARALAVPAVLAGLGAVVAVMHLSSRARLQRVLAWATLVVAIVSCARPLWSLRVTPYKALPQIEAYPDARRVGERWGPVGWVVGVEASAFRHAPGLSLAFEGSFPEQTALTLDGNIAGAVTRTGDDRELEFLEWLPSAAPYALGRREAVLVLGAGDDTEVRSALRHGASRVVAVELSGELLALRREIATAAAADFSKAEVEWNTGDVRSFVARDDRRFDVVTLSAAGGPGSSTAGVQAVSEDFLNTVEAYSAYLATLTDDGVFAVTRWLTVPPRAGVRTILTAAEALRQVDPDAPARGLAVVRSWGTTTVLAKPAGFSMAETDSLRAWCDARGFDLDWHPGIEAPHSRYHQLDEPTFYRAAQAATSGLESAERFAREYPFDVTPARDARPYPHHFLRASSLRAFVARDWGSWLPFAEWGYLSLFATLLQSVVLATLLTLIPLAVWRRSRPLREPRDPAFWHERSSYFAAIGLAYLAAEIAAVQQLALLLGHPVLAMAVVLGAFLVSSGLGSLWSERVSPRNSWVVGAALTMILLALGLFLLPAVHAAQSLPAWLRVAFALIVLAPPAFLMGMPFPLGLRVLVGQRGDGLAWAWTANAFASVVAAPLSGLISLEAGTPTLFLVAAGAYAVVTVLLRTIARPSGGGVAHAGVS